MSESDVNGKLDTLIDKVDNIEALLIGDLKDSNKVGLLSRVKKLEEWYAEIKGDLTWIKRAFWGGFLTFVFGVVLFIIQNSFK